MMLLVSRSIIGQCNRLPTQMKSEQKNNNFIRRHLPFELVDPLAVLGLTWRRYVFSLSPERRDRCLSQLTCCRLLKMHRSISKCLINYGSATKCVTVRLIWALTCTLLWNTPQVHPCEATFVWVSSQSRTSQLASAGKHFLFSLCHILTAKYCFLCVPIQILADESIIFLCVF